MKTTIEQLEFLIGEMKHYQAEHPKATIYYDWQDREIRITYPLPHDFGLQEICDIRPDSRKNMKDCEY